MNDELGKIELKLSPAFRDIMGDEWFDDNATNLEWTITLPTSGQKTILTLAKIMSNCRRRVLETIPDDKQHEIPEALELFPFSIECVPSDGRPAVKKSGLVDDEVDETALGKGSGTRGLFEDIQGIAKELRNMTRHIIRDYDPSKVAVLRTKLEMLSQLALIGTWTTMMKVH